MAQSIAQPNDTAQPRRATYQDVLDAPSNRVAEIIDGTLYTHPRPAMPHALASSALGNDLGYPFQFGRGGPGGWWIIDEPELHLGEDILVPDWRAGAETGCRTIPTPLRSASRRLGVRGALESSTRKVDLHEKRPGYAREGTNPPMACRPDGPHP